MEGDNKKQVHNGSKVEEELIRQLNTKDTEIAELQVEMEKVKI